VLQTCQAEDVKQHPLAPHHCCWLAQLLLLPSHPLRLGSSQPHHCSKNQYKLEQAAMQISLRGRGTILIRFTWMLLIGAGAIDGVAACCSMLRELECML
jgi:hypothetical protein